MDTNNYFSDSNNTVSDSNAMNCSSSIDSSIIPNTLTKINDFEILIKIATQLSTHLPEVQGLHYNKSGFKIKNGFVSELSISNVECDLVFPLICSLQHLERLLLNRTKITIIPPEIKNLQQLHYLELSHNLITNIPHELLVLSSLKFLDLSFNGLKEFYVTEKDLFILETLILEHNSLEIVSFSNGACPNLQECFLQYNKIASLQLSTLSSLKIITLNNNLLTSFPPISNLTNLEHIEIHFNRLTVITSHFSNLKKLHLFSISYNQIIDIDFSLFPQHTIMSFFINGNPLSKRTRRDLRNFRKNFLLKI